MCSEVTEEKQKLQNTCYYSVLYWQCHVIPNGEVWQIRYIISTGGDRRKREEHFGANSFYRRQ